MQEYTIHDIELNLSDDSTWTEMIEAYNGFLMGLVQEINYLVVAGQFNSIDELDSFIEELVEDFAHVYTPSLAKKYMSLTRNAAAFMREISRYELIAEDKFFYQLAYFAQVADLKDELMCAKVYDWFSRVVEREALFNAS